MSTACLVIVFNHRYDKNIPVLEKMYASRFKHIRFLVPFYDGDRKDVIPVYESSHYFQSFFAQGFHRFYDDSFSHYVFIGDDCILNPALNESNIAEALGLDNNSDFISDINPLDHETDHTWWHTFKGIDFFNNRKGAEIKRELPSREEAVARFAKHGINVKPLTLTSIFGKKTPPDKKPFTYWLFKQFHARYKWKKYRRGKLIELPYPIAGAYSDILVISQSSIRQFCHYCGIMGAAGLFVEIAVPTALLLSSQKIVEEKNAPLKGKALWTAAEIGAIEEQHQLSLQHLTQHFPEGHLFLHPVKLSKWKNDL